ncbi:MAG: site-2 protease family protein [Candidatus Colwellbacteria bacterium]|nr:site-2 protease family protein [Candidatus Colwellbacteria bacterium]
MSLFITSIIFISILIIGHEFGHFFAAKLFKLKVLEFSLGFPPRIFSKKIGETKYSFNALPFGGFVRIHGEEDKGEELEEPERSFIHQPAWRRALIILAGVIMNFLIGWLALTLVLSVGLPNRVIIEEVFPGSPASEAGFKTGDQIKDFNSAETFSQFIEANKGQSISLNGQTLTPRADPPEGEGPLGIKIVEVGAPSQNFARSLWQGLVAAILTLGFIFKAIFFFFAGVFTGNFAVLSEVTGPVGVFSLINDAGELGFIYLVNFLGLISLNLAAINLIPFPALDGGRLLFVGVEKLIGRPVNRRWEAALNALGLALLLTLMLVITFRDIMKLI